MDVKRCMPRKSEASKKEEHKELNSKSDLPKWQPEPDQPSSLEKFIRYCRTEKCSNFQAGHCELHKPKMQCFNFHFEGQRRRSPLGADGTLQYWELPCKWISQSSKCPRGDQCTLAHSKGEISYHPAKYKTRVCNGSDCQKATCCFAHSDKELRSKAAARYSHHSASGLKDVPEETEENWDEAPGKPTVDLSTFKVFPCRKSRGIQHDRKLCPFFHNPRDRRRPPGTYSAEPCDECFDSMAEQREGATSSRSSCSRGDSCRFCHNRPELLYHESVFKRRFCATFPKVESCQRGDLCAFAHSREEVRVELLQPEEEKFMVEWLSSQVSRPVPPAVVDFFTNRFKTLWCPYGTQHGWHECLYAHTDQDWRRRPSLGYTSEPCPEWAKHVGERLHYDERCPNGLRCRFAHGSKDQLYHPFYYKTMPCTDWAGSGTCPRGPQCAFFHEPEEQRQVSIEQKEVSTVEGSHRVPEVLSVLEVEAALSRGFTSVEGCDPRLEGPIASAASADGATTLGMRTSFGSLASLASLASSNSVLEVEAALSRGFTSVEGCDPRLEGPIASAASADGATTLGMRTSFGSLASLASLASSNSVRLSQMPPLWPLGSCPEEVAGNYLRL